jgi:hypothetical protein
MLVLHHKSLLAQFLPWLSEKPEKNEYSDTRCCDFPIKNRICDFNIYDWLLDLV